MLRNTATKLFKMCLSADGNIMTWFWLLPGIPILMLVSLRMYLHRGASKLDKKYRLDGKTVLITGGSSGIGRATVRLCAERGARVYSASHSTDPSLSETQQLQLDLASLRSVRRFVSTHRHLCEKTDVIICNAAYMGPRDVTKDGFDRTFQLNYLAHLLLLKLMCDVITRPLRVVLVSSEAHRRHILDVSDLEQRRGPDDPYSVYGSSKLLQLLAMQRVNAGDLGPLVQATAVHPGCVSSNLMRHFRGVLGSVLRLIARLTFRSPAQGAVGVVHAASMPDREFELCVGRLLTDGSVTEISAEASNNELSRIVWNKTNVMLGDFVTMKS